MVNCVLRNLDSEQVFELRESISEIAKFSETVNYNRNLMEALSKLQYCKTAAAAKQIAKKVVAKEAMPIAFVTVGLTDLKRVS